jgi:tripartite-type tricarboxylate transporter receptor subunit TctC
MKLQSRVVGILMFIAGFTSLAGIVHAQGYPNRPIRIIIPFPPGGISDALSRYTAQYLTTALGQQAVVDNRPGAGTTIGADLAAKSPPDGYTLYFFDETTHAINATLYSRLPYDSIKSFTPIAMVAQTPLILVIHPSLPVKSVKELIALAKARPGQVNYASSGNGTILHLSGETLKSMAGIDMVHIPYKGSAPAVAAVLGGEASLVFSTTPAALPHVKAGKLRALAVTSAKRSPVLPDVPAMAETLKGFDIILYNGVMGPAGLPRDIVMKLHAELTKMLAQPRTREAWASYGADPVNMTPEQFAEQMKSDIAKLGKMVQAAGAKVD